MHCIAKFLKVIDFGKGRGLVFEKMKRTFADYVLIYDQMFIGEVQNVARQVWKYDMVIVFTAQ